MPSFKSFIRIHSFNPNNNPMKGTISITIFLRRKTGRKVEHLAPGHTPKQSKGDLEPRQPGPKALNLTTHTPSTFQGHHVRIFSSHYSSNTKIWWFYKWSTFHKLFKPLLGPSYSVQFLGSSHFLPWTSHSAWRHIVNTVVSGTVLYVPATAGNPLRFLIHIYTASLQKVTPPIHHVTQSQEPQSSENAMWVARELELGGGAVRGRGTLQTKVPNSPYHWNYIFYLCKCVRQKWHVVFLMFL